LIEDPGDELGKLFVFAVAVDCECVAGDGCVDCGKLARTCAMEYGEGSTLRRGEMDHIPVFLKHVDFLDGLDGLNVHLFEGCLEFLVVNARGCGL
jgi:hypothetical protein